MIKKRPEKIVLHPKQQREKLSWEETFRQTAAEKEDWGDWESTCADGIAEL